MLVEAPRCWRIAALMRAARAKAHGAQCLRRRVLAVVRRQGLSFLTCRNAHNFDSIADHIGGAALAFRAARHQSFPEATAARVSSISAIR